MDTVWSIVIVLSVVESYRRVVGEFSYDVWVRIRHGDFSDIERLEREVMMQYAG